MSEFQALLDEVTDRADPECAQIRARFFKTRPGEYGAGDEFAGLTVPQQREVARRHPHLSLSNIHRLLHSKVHERRFIALVILVHQYQRGSPEAKLALVDFYLAHLERVNNWDLVDTSAPYILGEHLKSADHRLLEEIAQSSNLWARRVAMVSTLSLTKSGNLEPALRIAKMLLDDRHDLIHKAVGWMLREVGRKDRKQMLTFLKEHYPRIPRTTLRYAIEHLPPDDVKAALTGVFTI